MRWFWNIVWELSERTGIGLGKFAPWVFKKKIGLKKMKRIK